MPGTTDKKTNKTESLRSKEEGAVRGPDVDKEQYRVVIAKML